MTDRLPARPVTTPPARPDTRTPAASPVHTPATLVFEGTTPTREELWPRLSDLVRERVGARSGQFLEWWAKIDDGARISAVVLGDRALVTVNPTVNASGQRVMRLREVVHRPGSLKSVAVTGDGRGSGTASAAPVPGGRLTKGLASRMDADFMGTLGHLPERAQHLLQDPFLESTRPLTYDAYLLSVGNLRSIEGGTLYAWLYITDCRHLTVCGGIGHGYREARGVSAWTLTCWRSEVVESPDGPCARQ